MKTYNKNDPETIQKMFGSIAKKYDSANQLLSLNMHRRWNSRLIKEVMAKESPTTYLDLCSGTGEIAFSYLSHAKAPCQTFMVDFCEEMLQCAKEKASANINLNKHDIHYIQADVQKLPLPNTHVACATMAYGIRNVQNPDKCIQEVFRVLKPGGRFGILELTEPTNPIMRFGHKIYLQTMLPVLGNLVASNRQAYQYLSESIHSFIKPAKLEEILKNIGFREVTQKPLMGGIATILISKK